MLTEPLVTTRLVLLNSARPFTVLLASFMVMVVPPEVIEPALPPCSVKLPLRLLTLVTPEVPPLPPVVRQVGQVRLPAESSAIGPDADTATVPLALGRVMVLFEPLGVAKIRLFVILPEVELRFTVAPCRVRFWPVEPTVRAAVGVIVLTLRVPPILTVVPSSLMIELPMVPELVNLAMVLVVPPGVVTSPPTPAQLPAVVQMSYVPAVAGAKLYVTFAVGF